MNAWWTVSLLTLLALGQSAVSVVPGTCPRQTNVCYYDNVAKLLPASSGQYFAVGGLFDLHQRGQDAYSCGTEFLPTGILHTQAFLWSLGYWQTGSSSVSVGAVVFDSCERKPQLIQNVLGFEQCNLQVPEISRHNVVGFVGPTDNMGAMAAAQLTADMDLTLISPAADARSLSDAKHFRYFLRTTPTIQMDIDIMTYMLTHVETNFVAVIYLESHMAAVNSFRDRMKENKICISGSYPMMGDESSEALTTFVRETLATLGPTRFVALFMSPDFLEKFLDHISAEEDVRSMNLVFLMNSQIRLNSNIFQGQHAVAASDAIILERAEPASDEVQEAVRQFRNYWKEDTILASMAQSGRVSDPFLIQYLNAGNRLPEFDVDAAYTIMATKAFVDGTRQAGIDSGCGSNTYLCPQFFDSDTRGSTIYQKIRNSTNFFTTDRDDEGRFIDGDLRKDVIRYNIYRYIMNGTLSKIGEYRGGATPILSQPIKGMGPYGPGQCQDTPCPQCPYMTITTTVTNTIPSRPSTTPRKCQPEHDDGNITRVYYPYGQEITGAYMVSSRHDSEFATRFAIGQRWIIALGVLAGLGIVAVLVFEVYILYKLLGTRMGHKWRTMWLGQLLLLGILLCYIVLFAYLFIPTRETCAVTRFGVGVSLSVCFAVLLVKLMVILTSKTSSDVSYMPGDGHSTNYLRGIYQFLMFVFVVGVQVVIDAQWLISVPPEAVKVISNTGQKVWVCNHYTFRASDSANSMTDMASFVRSEFENHLLSLVYIMFLILITTVLALNAHGIITNHRESVFIGISSGFCIPIWLAWTLVGGLNNDHDYAHEFGDACIAFGLFLTATLILFAMFLPKVRQLVSMGVEGIYFEDDRETIYAGSVIMAPSYKSPNSVIYVNSHGDPVVLGNGEGVAYVRQASSEKPTPVSTYSAPPAYMKKGSDSTRGGNVLRVTDDLSGRRPLEKKQAVSDVGHRSGGRPSSNRGTLPRSRSYNSVGAL